MADIYVEQIVKRAGNPKTTIKKILLVLGLLAVVAFASLLPVLLGFLPLIAIAAIVAGYFAFTRLNMEYEYTFTNGELDIDVIYNKASRKRLLNCQVRDLEFIAPMDSNEWQNHPKAATVKDFSSGMAGAVIYAFCITKNGNRTKYLIEPNDSLLSAFALILPPRRLFRQ